MAFYRRLLEQDGLNPTETVFIDDMNRNVQSAEDVGIRGILLGRGMMVTDLFDEELKLLC